jgi:MFS family permease
MTALRDYVHNIKKFSPQARLYLFVSVLQGVGWGIFQLFFNFYILSLGYQRDFLGMLISIPPMTSIVMALFAGYISDLIGRKRAFIFGNIVTVIAQAMMLLWPTSTMLILAGILRGAGQSLFRVTTSPFLMENSTESERTHLFSFSSGLRTLASFLGNFLGGGLPALFGNFLGVSATDSLAYAWSLGITTMLTTLTLIPLSRLEVQTRVIAQSPLAPFKALWQHRSMMTRLLLPSLVLSLGAGMLIPFMNIFFRYRYNLSDDTIGALFGIGSLGMGFALMMGPILAERWGKPKTVVITQGLSIPFLIILGFVHSLTLAYVAFFVRMALMNLAGPVYQTMVMEEADAEARGMAASLYSLIWSSGRALSPVISGPIQEAHGFDPVFLSTIFAYTLSVGMVYWWFVQGRHRRRSAQPLLNA